MTTNEAPEVWRMECEGGEVVEARVGRARQGGSVAVCGSVEVWSAERVDAVPYYAREASSDTPRAAVTSLAARGGLAVVSVLAPGEATRAELAAQLAATEAEARRALDALHARCDAAEAAVAAAVEAEREACAAVCDERAARTWSPSGVAAVNLAAVEIRARGEVR